MTDDRQRLLRELCEKLVAEGPSGAPESCPDPNLLAAFSDGVLEPVEGESVLAHAALCAQCRALLDQLRGDPGLHAGTAPPCEEPSAQSPALAPQLRPRASGLMVAAAILLACAMLALNAVRLAGRWTTQDPLLAALEELANTRPDLFAEFRLFGAGERNALVRPLLRSPGVALLHPARRVLSPRPGLRWEAVAGAATYRVGLRADSGEQVFEAESSAPALPWPAEAPDLEPGRRYLWDVEASGLFGIERGTGSFECPSEEEGSRLREALEVIRQRAPPDLRDLLVAHYALRHQLAGEAERSLRALLRGDPGHPEGRALLRDVLRSLGAAEAEQWKPEVPRGDG